MDCILGIVTKIVSIVGEELLYHVKNKMCEQMLSRSDMYQLLCTRLDEINNKLDLIINEPYKTALTYFKTGVKLNTVNDNDNSNYDDFKKSYEYSIKAFHLAPNIKRKFYAIDLAASSVILYKMNKEEKNQMLDVLVETFIKDDIVIALFKCIRQTTWKVLLFGHWPLLLFFPLFYYYFFSTYTLGRC